MKFGDNIKYSIGIHGRKQKNGKYNQCIEGINSDYFNTITTIFRNCMLLDGEKIRKLTPLECWRLFDFDDNDYFKAKNALNETFYNGRDKCQTKLYKQAGNTIVVNTLASILKQLNIKEHIDVAEFFCGIGAQRKALERAEIDFTVVDAVDIDKYSIASYNGIFGTDFKPQDITKWNKDINIDLLFHTSPCQDFSAAGKQAGGDEGSGTRSSLMHEAKRIISKSRPKYIIWENVKGVTFKKNIHNLNKYLDDISALGYNNYWKVLNSKDYGTPQARERIFVVSIRKDIDIGYEFPEPIPLEKTLQDILEQNVDDKFYIKKELSDELIDGLRKRVINPTITVGGLILRS